MSLIKTLFLLLHQSISHMDKLKYFLSLIMVLVCAACSPTEGTATTATLPSPEQVITLTESIITPEPTEMPIIEKTILLAPEGAAQNDIDAIEPILMSLSKDANLAFEVMADPGGQDLAPGTRVVVALQPDLGVASLAASNSTVQFLAIGIEGINPTPNLSVIENDNNRPDQKGFLAGYLSAVITPQWRVGVISLLDDPQDRAQRNGFKNGVIFYCGLCRPAFPPFIQYPLTISLPATVGMSDYQPLMDQLRANAVDTVYVAAGFREPALYEAIAGAGINIIGTEPPMDSYRAHYIAAIQSDLGKAVEGIWPDLLAGNGGQSIRPDLLISDVNRDLLSTGRQDFVEQMLSELLGGYIDTGVDSLTGEFVEAE